eukprot:3358230-Amphidinium_carterae.1
MEDPAAPAAKQPKRTKTHAPREVQVWFLHSSKFMEDRHQYSTKRCLDIAKHWFPEIFDGLHKDSISRWKAVGAASTAGSSGRKKLASEEQGMIMSATVFDLIKSGAAISTELVASLWQEKFHINPSTFVSSWAWTVRSFLHDLGLSFKTATRTTKPPTVEEERDAQTLLCLKLMFCMEEHNIDYPEVYNLDETVCHLLPSLTKAWYFTGQHEKATWSWDKQFITCTL